MRSDLVKDLLKLAATLPMREFSGVMRRVQTAAAFNVGAALAMVCGVLFLLGAAFALAAERWGIAPAALGFGTAFVVLAIAVYGFGRLAQRRRARELELRRQADVRMLTEKATQTMVEGIFPREGHTGTVVALLAALAGYAIYRENSGARARGLQRNSIEDLTRKE